MRCGNRSHVGTDASHLRVAHRVYDRAWIHWLRDSSLRIDGDIMRTRNLKAEDRLGSVLPGLRPNANRQKSLDGTNPECCLVPVPLHAPGKDANLVEIEGKPRFRRTQGCHEFRNLVIGNIRFRIGDVCKHIGRNPGSRCVDPRHIALPRQAHQRRCDRRAAIRYDPGRRGPATSPP